jgi:hypothetical protein
MAIDDAFVPTHNRSFVLRKIDDVEFEDRPMPDLSTLKGDE